MKLSKLLIITMCLAISVQLAAQDIDPDEIYYGLEILPVGEEDTSSNMLVMLTITTSDLDLFSEVEVESLKNYKKLKVSKEDREDNPRIKLKDKNYHLDMEEWSKDAELSVKAKLLDGTKIKLKRHPRSSEFTHLVVTAKPKTRSVQRYEGPEIVEQEKEK